MNRLTDLDACARCKTILPPPTRNVTHAARLKRLCKPCRAQQVREIGARSHTAHYAVEPTYEAQQVIIGSAFGDGGFERNSKAGPWRLAIKHGRHQHAYVTWKAALLGPLARKMVVTENNKLRVRTATHPFITKIHDQWCSHNEAAFRALVASMDLLAWTIFYLDDGSLNPTYERPTGQEDKTTVRLCIPTITLTQRRWLREGLEARFQVKTTQAVWTRTKDQHHYYGVRLYGENALKFLTPLLPLVPAITGMCYKFDEPLLTTLM